MMYEAVVRHLVPDARIADHLARRILRVDPFGNTPEFKIRAPRIRPLAEPAAAR